MTDNVNTTTVFILILAAICLAGWLIWIVRLISCRAKLHSRNKLLLSKMEEIQKNRRMIDSYEDLMEGYKGQTDTTVSDFRKSFRNLGNQVRQSKIYLKEKVAKDDLAALVGMDRKAFDQMFHDLSPIESVSDWIDSFRITDAIESLRQLKAQKKSKSSDKSEGTGAEEDDEKKMERIAHSCGFSSRRALNSACKKIVGMSLGELHRAV